MYAFPHVVAACPSCGGRHRFSVVVEGADAGVLVFAGPDAESDASVAWDVDFRCPSVGESFVEQIPIRLRTGQRPTSVVSRLEGDAPAATPDWADAEFAEWVRSSVATARDFCRTMITTAAAAIPVYFAVLTYLGVGSVERGWALFTVGPPLLFLAAGAIFVLALRPVLQSVERSTFEEMRARRLRTMNTFILWGVTAFCAATLSAIAIFFALLWR